MKTNRLPYLSIATIIAIIIPFVLAGCAGEELIVLRATHDGVVYTYDQDSMQGTVAGYSVSDGNIHTQINIPAEIDEYGKIYKITTIADRAFVNCQCTSVTIGTNMATIGSRAFHQCEHLDTIRLTGKTAPAINEDTFDANTYEKGILYVPEGCGLNKTPWNKFKNISTGK